LLPLLIQLQWKAQYFVFTIAAFLVQGSSAEGNPYKEIIMVDPLEAKRLAAKQMQEIKAKERFRVCQ